MSYRQPAKRSNRATTFYPAMLVMANGFPMKTGPYEKARCGETQGEVTEYLVHLVDNYEEHMKGLTKEQKEKDAFLAGRDSGKETYKKELDEVL